VNETGNIGDDARLELIDKLSALAVEHKQELDVNEAAWLSVIDRVIELWRSRWLEATSKLVVEGELDRKFRVCFPLAAHALNHVRAATAVRAASPWVAVSSARIAFEHALSAQWVLVTRNGEDQLAQQMSVQLHRRANEFVGALGRAATDEPSLAECASLGQELHAFVGGKQSSDWSVTKLCDRFCPTRLFYDVYRDLSQAVHPTYALVGAYLEMTQAPECAVRGINAHGAASQPAELTRGLALAGLWALYVVEVCRKAQPYAAEVVEMGAAVGLPVDLRASDQEPHLQ
jgi:hypothetical protein